MQLHSGVVLHICDDGWISLIVWMDHIVHIVLFTSPEIEC